MQNNVRLGSTFLLLLASGALVAWTGSSGRIQQQGGGRGSGRQSAPVHDSTCGSIAAKDTSGDSSPKLELRWATWDIPEFQDQQRLVGDRDGLYGPLACVVAKPHLENVTMAQFNSSDGVVVAITYVRFGDLPVNANYVQLGISNPSYRFNCVIIRHRSTPGPRRLDPGRMPGTPPFGTPTPSADDDNWEGFIAPSTAGKCAIGGRPPLPGMRLSASDLHGDSYPAVARFVIDTAWRAGIGVRCGEAWCTVGMRMNELSAPAHGYSATGSIKPRSRRLVFGWYDDQYIAIPSAATGPSVPIRAHVRASVIPDTGLDRYDMTRFENGTFTTVATIHFNGEPTGKYRDKWHFTNAAVHENVMKLRHIKIGGAWKWQVTIDDTTRALKVTQTLHVIPGFHIVGTARWSWSDKDEAIWVRCDEGCCRVEPD